MIFLAWCKKYWALLVGGLIALLGFLLGVSVKKKPILVQGDDGLKEKADEELRKALGVAQTAHDKAVTAVKLSAEKEQAKVVDDEQGKTESVKDDVNKTNDYLKEVATEIKAKP